MPVDARETAIDVLDLTSDGRPRRVDPNADVDAERPDGGHDNGRTWMYDEVEPIDDVGEEVDVAEDDEEKSVERRGRNRLMRDEEKVRVCDEERG